MSDLGNSSVYDWDDEKEERGSSVPVYEWGSEEKFELLAWVKASERRVEILTSLGESPKNINDFGDSWGVTLEAVRYHFQQLQTGGPVNNVPGLIELLTPDRRQYKLYGLTETGLQVLNFLNR